MTLDEQVLACAKENGYTNKTYGDEHHTSTFPSIESQFPSIESQLKYNEIEIKRPKYSFENGAVHFKDPGHWEIYNHVRHYIFKVTDEQFKQWQRDNKLNQLGV